MGMGYYIGGVGQVKAFMRDSSGNLNHYFDAKTLTDSSINISISNEDIRGGDGGKLLAKYFHTESFKITLTDALFDLKYISALVGSDITIGDGTKIVIKKNECFIEYFGALSEDRSDYELVGLDGSAKLLATANTREETTCDIEVKTVKNCRQVKINSNYKPREMALFLKVRLFAGSNKVVSNGKPVGDLVIEIPRFQLDGDMELPLKSNGAVAVPLNGTALSVSLGCCDERWCAKISEFIPYNVTKYKGYDGVTILDTEKLQVGDTIPVYAIGKNKTPIKMESNEYTISGKGVDCNGRIVGKGSVRVKPNFFECDQFITLIWPKGC